MAGCPNCSRPLESVQEVRFGFHEGTLNGRDAGRALCPVCGQGCYTWSENRNPGTESIRFTLCCKCGKNPADHLNEV